MHEVSVMLMMGLLFVGGILFIGSMAITQALESVAEAIKAAHPTDTKEGGAR